MSDEPGGKIVALPMGLVYAAAVAVLALVLVNIALLVARPANASAGGRYQSLGGYNILDTETGAIWRRERGDVNERGFWSKDQVEGLVDTLPALPAAVLESRTAASAAPANPFAQAMRNAPRATSEERGRETNEALKSAIIEQMKKRDAEKRAEGPVNGPEAKPAEAKPVEVKPEPKKAE